MPRMTAPSRFSVHNTRIRRLDLDGKPFVEKTIRRNVPLPMSLEELDRHLSDYRERLAAAGVGMPHVADTRVDGGSIICLCADGGPNLVEQYETPEVLVNEHRGVLESAVGILKRAADAGTAIDPHIKNFVGEGEELFYVDFSPPLVDAYIEARCAAARDREEREILQRNFAYFTGEFIPYHFAGDFLNVDSSAESLFPELYALLDDAGLLEGVSLESFTAKACSIRALEDLRLSRGVFMI